MVAVLSPSPLFTSWEVDHAAALLGTGFMRFSARAGVDGLAKIEGKWLEILAVVCMTPGLGCFRNFITQAKEQFEVITILGIWNPWLESVLDRYGFTSFVREEDDGGLIDGMVWKKTKTES